MRLLLASLLLLLPSCVTAAAASRSEGTSTLTEEPATKPRKARVPPAAPRPVVEVATPATVEAPPAVDPVAVALRKRGLLASDASSRKDVQASLRAFQKSQGLAETGFADQLTLKRLDVEARK
jgi:murein L,D-transpeptidase YcbB/YkuD